MPAPDILAGLHLPFAEQQEFFRKKLNLPTERWDDIWQEAHDQAFVVAGAMKADLLNDLRQAVDKAISQGTTLEEFRKDFKRIVADRGWTGWTGEGSPAGEAWRTKVIYETNLRSSYAAGRYAQLTDPDLIKRQSYWRYVHNDSVLNPRPHHKAWGDAKLTLRHDHPFWKTHFPPNGWGCRCRVTAVAAPKAGDSTEPPEGWDVPDSKGRLSGIDAGWAYAPGRSVAESLRQLVASKVSKLPAPLAQALRQDVAGLLTRHPEALATALKQEMAAIAAAPLEHLAVFNQAGETLLKKTGAADHVALTAPEAALLKDAVLVHNHPGIPQSFSVDDIKLAVEYGLQEIHAVDRLYHYQVSRPAGAAWGPEYWRTLLGPTVQRIEADVRQRLDQALAAGKITASERVALFDHMIWEEVNQEIPLGYLRLLRNEP